MTVRLAVAGHPQRFALGGRHHLLADHQQAVLVAGDEALDQHGAGIAFFGGDARRRRARRLRVIRFSDTPRPWLPSTGLTTTGRPMSCGFFPGRFARCARRCLPAPARRRRRAGVLVRSLSLAMPSPMALVRSVSAVQMRRWRGAVAELHQVAVGQADRRDAALGGGIDDVRGATGRGSSGRPVSVSSATVACRSNGRVVDGGHQQRVAGLQRGAADALVARAEGHLVDAAVGGGAGLAEAGLHAGQVLQFEHDVFEDVAGPGAVAQALEEAAALADAAAVFDQARQPGGQAFVQAGEGVRRTVFELADVEPGFDDGAVGPDVRSAQVGYTKNCNVFLVCHENILPRGDRSLTAWRCLCVYVALQPALASGAAAIFCNAHVVYLPERSLPCRTDFCQSGPPTEYRNYSRCPRTARLSTAAPACSVPSFRSAACGAIPTMLY